MSDDVETAQSISFMEELAAFDAGERTVIDATHRALADFGVDMNASPRDKAYAIFAFLKRTIRYVPTPATSLWVDQTLIAPSALLQMKDPEGDCPQFSMLASSMFRICCVPCFFKTIATEAKLPNIYSHVYNVVEIETGKLMPFDSSNGPSAGAEYAMPFKQRVWLATIPDKCTKGKTAMLKNGMATRGRRYSSLRGLRGTMGSIVCDDDGNCADTLTGEALDPSTFTDLGYQGLSDVDPTAIAAQASVLPGGSGVGTFFASSAPAAAPSSSTPGFATTLANDLTSILSPLSKAVATSTTKPYYITNAAGQQVLYNPATGQVVSSSVSAALSNPIIIVGLGILVFAMIAKK